MHDVSHPADRQYSSCLGVVVAVLPLGLMSGCAPPSAPAVPAPTAPAAPPCLCPPPAPCPAAPSLDDVDEVHDLQLLAAVPKQATTRFHGQRRDDLRMQTTQWDVTPSVMASSTTPYLVVTRNARITLAGDAAGSKEFGADNFVLFEVLNLRGAVTARAIIGYTEPVLINGEAVDRLGRNAFTFAPRSIDLTALLPRQRPFALRVTALDYGAVGWVTDWYLLVEE